tara:strand:- start:168 stop:539 length:372 start_codon:yes stop_codon:yes gene_type:complete
MSNPIYAGSDDLQGLNYRLQTQDPDFVLSTLGTGYQGFYDSGDLVYDDKNNKFMWASKDSKPLFFSNDDDDSNVVKPKPKKKKDELKARKSLLNWTDFGDSLMDMAQESNVPYQYDIFGGGDD